MSTNSSIEWTEATWNPVAGCTPVSPGCLHCYAAVMAHRLEAMGQSKYVGLTVKRNGIRTFNGKINLDHDALLAPLSWKKPRRVFVNSMSDLFHEGVPFNYVAKVYAVSLLASQHTMQILTKRPERAVEFYGWLRSISGGNCYDYLVDLGRSFIPADVIRKVLAMPGRGEPVWPLSSVWLGTSVERQQEADERIPHLLGCPAAVRFLSCEPLLEAVDLTNVGPEKWDVTRGWKANANNERGWANTSRVDWVIVGGESGQGARPMSLEWARTLVRQCQAAELPVFVKQLGSKPVTDRTPSGTCRGQVPVEWYPAVKLRDSKGGDPVEWSEDLRVRQFPAQPAVV